MVDRDRTLESFLKLLSELEQDKSSVRTFEVFFRDGTNLRLILYEVKSTKEPKFELIRNDEVS